MPADRSNLPIDPFFGGFILETLTVGMYEESKNAIREYVQNGFDSIQKAIHELEILSPGGGRIEITLSSDHSSLTIRDNGAGIPARVASDLLTRVGASNKDHRRNAGFRGIGRLSGIVFSDTLTFTTKAKGESKQTTVTFNAKAMREGMAPSKGSAKSASRLLRDTVSAYTTSGHRRANHFLEVKLDGLADPPKECINTEDMLNFLGQVAPVPYADDFPYVRRIQNAAEDAGIPIEEVEITVREGRKPQQHARKPYRATYEFESGRIPLLDCDIIRSRSKKWWGWVGKKAESGTFDDPRVAGLRFRVRNIQIDDTDVFREIFKSNKPSHERFQGYYVGEIFVRPGILVPNARRDGFEDNRTWHTVVKELKIEADKLAKHAYRTSREGSMSLDALNEDLAKKNTAIKRLRRASFSNTDKAIDFSSSITTAQRRVAKALQAATFDGAVELHAIASELDDLKRETLSHIGTAELQRDREAIQGETRTEMLEDILVLLGDKLSPGCFASAREILIDEYGDD